MQPFYVGQRVVALNGRNFLTKGEEYIIKNIKPGCKHIPWIVDVGIADSAAGICTKCTFIIFDNVKWFTSSLFSPIIEEFEAISFSKIMEEELTSVN